MSHEPKINVIVFGETGAGKSSLLNMLDGGNQADVGNSAKGVTFNSTCYDKTILGASFQVFDTVGLNEGMHGTVTARAAIEGLYRLIRQLDDGVNLLVYVMRAPRLKVTAQQNYEMFFEVFCNRQVPIVIVITGLEDEERMDQWWDDNREPFQQYKMSFSGFACITASKGKLRGGIHLYEAEFEESKRKVEKLIYESYSPKPWKMPTKSWFATTAVRVHNICATVLGSEPLLLASELYHALKLYAGLSDREAMAEANKIERNYGTPQQESVPNVIVFGESGAGKSSILNMLEGGGKADVSMRAKGVTFDNACFVKCIWGLPFRIFDTVGLNEGTAGTVTARDAIERLYGLMRQLDDGVNLLVYVMRAPRIKATAQQNYEMFFDVFCQKSVPIVIVITGLEDEERMDQWWDDNRATFDRHKMSFKGVACITAYKGKLRDGVHLYELEYEESKGKVEKLIYESHNPDSWKMPTKPWFAQTAVKVHNICAKALGIEPLLIASELFHALKSYAGLSDREAMAEAYKIEQGYRKATARGPVPNVIIFGETGAGKSSIVNVLDGGRKAVVSSQGKGTTFSSACYEKTILGSTFKIFDTVGLNEGPAGTVAAKDAIEGLYKLIRRLDDGINLLIYVMRAPRITRIAQRNYELFFEIFCDKKVPIVIVITGLEDEERMDQWWDDNKNVFEEYQMRFSGFACITATKGKLRGGVHLYETEYEESKQRVERLIYGWHNPVPWKMPTNWFSSTAVRMHNVCAAVLGFEPAALARALYRALKSYGGLSDKEALAQANRIALNYQPGRRLM